MTTQSPKKPWETGQANITTQPQTQPQTVSSQPAIPTRPTSNIGINGMGAVGYGQTGAYGGIGTGMGGYGNSYAGMGGYGQSTYGGIGGYGQNSYGGYGGNSYGMNRMSSYGGGMNSYGGGYGNQRFGMNGMGMNGVPTMQQQMEQSTQSTFQMLDQVVQTFGGFSQMLESTFFATHSSFMAMIGVADQFSQLKNYFGQIFSIMALYKHIKSYAYRLTGKTDLSQISADGFNDFAAPKKPRLSKKPLLVFLGLVFGLPWLFSKLIKRLEQNRPMQMMNSAEPLNIRNLEFCKATYDFQSDQPGDLPFRSGDLIAILSKQDPITKGPSDWWSGRTQEGNVGIFPMNYVQVIPRHEDSSSIQKTADDLSSPLKLISTLSPSEFL